MWWTYHSGRNWNRRQSSEIRNHQEIRNNQELIAILTELIITFWLQKGHKIIQACAFVGKHYWRRKTKSFIFLIVKTLAPRAFNLVDFKESWWYETILTGNHFISVWQSLTFHRLINVHISSRVYEA